MHIDTVRLPNDDNVWYGTSGGEITEDRVFLLSLEEIERYFGVEPASSSEELICYPTQHAVVGGALVDEDTDGCPWWLRSPGRGSGSAAYVFCDGYVGAYGFWVNSNNLAVRPALWVSNL